MFIVKIDTKAIMEKLEAFTVVKGKMVIREAIKILKKEIKSSAPKKTGNLKKSIKSRVRASKRSANIQGKVFVDLEKAPYGDVIDKATNFFSKHKKSGELHNYVRRAIVAIKRREERSKL